MRSIPAGDLPAQLEAVLAEVARGETVIVVRDGHSIARISPGGGGAPEEVRAAVAALTSFPRVPLPEGVSSRDLIDEGRP